MPRPLRMEYAGAWYHIMNRGSNRQKIFLTTEHYQMFLSLLYEIYNKYYVEIHSYCLMSNHYHLLVKTPLANLSRAMRHLDGLYTQRFNRSENRDGALFRGRYKSIIVEAESYLLQLSRYIHLNPTEAKLCEDPYQYPWSSLQFYKNVNNNHSWLKTNVILCSDNSVETYEKFIHDGVDKYIQNFYQQKQIPSILGSKKFFKDKLNQLNKLNEQFYKPDIRIINQQIKLDEIIKVVVNYYQIDVKEIKIKTPGKTNLPKIFIIYLASQIGQFTNAQIGTHINLKSCSVGASMKIITSLINKSEEIRTNINQLIDLLLQ